jgi:predicted negative regulator of RcsB-dependent stress response
MPKAIKKKPKKKTHTEPDVQERLLDMKTIFEQKQKKIGLYGVALLVIILVAGGIYIYKYRSDEKAKQLEYKGYEVFYSEYSKQPLPGQERYQKALDLFQQAYKKKKTPRVLLYIANSYYQLGKDDQALKTLNDFTREYSDNRDLLPLAYKEMADIQLRNGKKEEALKTLDRLYNTPGGIFRDYALMESGRILESEGKKKEAMAKYKEITDEFKSSPFYEEARAKLGEKAQPEAKPEAKPKAKKEQK